MFISPLYVGSISDIDLTKHCGFLKKLEDKPGISIMADRGFTIKDILKELNIDLNIPPSWKVVNNYLQMTLTKDEGLHHFGYMYNELSVDLRRMQFVGRLFLFHLLV